jgi:tRNA(fMet)-specific endonuclease VapC
MAYSLDANTCIEHLRGLRRGRPSPVTARLDAEDQDEIFICSIVRAELLYGAEKSVSPATYGETRTFLSGFSTAPFDDTAAEEYARILADLERRGLKIGANDLFIAAIALANGLTLVTHNTGEFSRIPALKLDDWQ